MSGIYLHIPFCKQACHYCDFHFSTSMEKKGPLVKSICRELILRKDEIEDDVQTIYFGGGTPSLLTPDEMGLLLDTIHEHYLVSDYPEITLEANPDDLTEERVAQLADSPITRLSIGVQSFFKEDLSFMNRAHTSEEALHSVEMAMEHFENISIDLIYGLPGMTSERWEENLDKALELGIPHISCYALTVEPKTALHHFIEKGTVAPVDDEVAQEHHQILVAKTAAAGYDNYEFSNFGKPGFYSENNMAYWLGEPYLGVGPSAHSFDGQRRSWNVANNSKYIKAIEAGVLPLEREILSETDHYNEYVMTRLRTMWGISLAEVQDRFGKQYHDYLLRLAVPHLMAQRLLQDDDQLVVTETGKFLSDGIASDLFMIAED